MIAMRYSTAMLRSALAAAAGAVILLCQTSAAQTPERPSTAPSPRNPVIVNVGDPCWTRAERRKGVVKVDACGRWYCGRADVKDIIEVRPNIAEVLNCTWRLEGDRCRCRRDAAGPTSR
jgi:hypothetical protein